MARLSPSIRARALFLLWRGDDLLLIDWRDESTHQAVWLAPGGTIEYGEPAYAAAIRELREELGVGGIELHHLATFVSIFEYGDQVGHEVCFAFEAIAPPQLAKQSAVQGVESNGEPLTLIWTPASAIEAGERSLWPGPLRQYLVSPPLRR
ncbi:MAG TPA: NUDIX domain-containing protein [Tepidiformaceae bacterium]|nr:NUDIX domain-containing protein [Tepidiformaceae bacterium]